MENEQLVSNHELARPGQLWPVTVAVGKPGYLIAS
jgi:hypothetical protein